VRKILILGVAAVQMDAIKVLKELGYETYACAMSKDGPGADIADHFDIINILDIPALNRHIKTNKIDIIYSVGSDIAMPVVCKISEELSLPHFASYNAALTCNNKILMRETLGKDFEGNIPFQVIEDLEIIPDIEMPFIMKPSDSQGQRGIVLVYSLKEYRDNFYYVKSFSKTGKVIIEEFVNGPELSVNVYLIDGEIRYIIPSDRVTWENYTGLIHKHIVPTRVMDVKDLHVLEKVIAEACKRIGIQNGPAYFQIKLNNGRPYIIEMTPRLDGCHMWKLLSYYNGVNLLKLTFEHLINGDITELDNIDMSTVEHELEFFCQEPNTIINKNKFHIPDDALEHFFYYDNGEKIRPVNGKFDKVGYFIKVLGSAEL